MQKTELIDTICGKESPASAVSQPVLLSKGSGSGAAEARTAILADFLMHTTPEIPEGVDLSAEHFAALTRHVLNLSAEAGEHIIFDEARAASTLTIREAMGRLERLSEEHLQRAPVP